MGNFSPFQIVKWCGSNFAKCTICELLKDLISKVGKNSAGAKEHEMKLRKHVNSFITLKKLNQSSLKKSTFVSSMTRWIIPKLFFLNLLWKTKWFLVWVNFPSLWLVWLLMVMEMRPLFSYPASFGQMIWILWLGFCCGYFEP
jgi:hypothetical protein